MSEHYTVTINNQTAVEITGGRVGNFIIRRPENDAIIIGDSELSIAYSSPTVISNGVVVANRFTGYAYQFYVTSPDEVFAMFSQSGSLVTSELEVFHNR